MMKTLIAKIAFIHLEHKINLNTKKIYVKSIIIAL